MTESKVDIVENWNFVADFPETPSPLIERPHLLRSIVEVLNADAPVLFIEGEPGDGATCTLAQFCRSYPDQTFSLFIKPASKLTYSLDYLRLSLAEQFHWYVYGEALRKDRLTGSEYQDLVIKLSRKDKGKELYFVVDGLHQIPVEDRSVIGQVFSELLPTGVRKCRFIVAGLQSGLGEYVHASVRSRYYGLLKFSLDECKKFLAETGIGEADCERVYELCKGGSPGRLAVVRRLLIGGTPLSEILEKDPTKYLEFVKLEFDSLKSLSEDQRLLVANVAFSKVAQTLSDLCEIGQVDLGVLEHLIEKCHFLRISSAGHVEFISETHRQFACKNLEQQKRNALESQLKFFESHPKSEAALRFLPTYLETLNRQEALFELLSKEHYGDLLETTQSFSALMNQAEMAAKSAYALQRTQEVFKFSLHKSIFSSATSAEGSSSRVKALVALGKTNAAMALANTEATKEDRLRLLSAFARRLTERNGTLEPELLSYINRLIDEVDFSALGDKAVNIAADVLMFDPDSAIGIIESAVKGATAAAKDAAFAELSLSASLAKIKNKAKIEDKARQRISDEALQQIAHSFELIAEKLDSSELINILSKMPAARQIHFLRSVVNMKRKDPRILDLVELGLDIIIKEAEYTPRAKDLAELCSPLLFPIKDHGRLKTLVTRIQSQLGLVGKAAQSRDMTMLQMRLAAGEYQYDRAAARDRIREACYAAMDIKAPETQMECLAVMLGILAKIDRDGELENADGFRAVIRCELNQLLDHVLRDTADHIGTVLPLLKVLAADDCQNALVLAKRLNVESRRDVAYQTVAEIFVTQPYSHKLHSAIETALSSISSEDSRSRATESLLSYLDANPEKSGWVAHLDSFRRYLQRGYQLNRWDCWMFKSSSAAGCEYDKGLFVERTKEALQRIASGLEEAKLNFRAAEALADVDVELAEKYYADGLRVSAETPFASESKAQLFELCLSLVGRSMASLARVRTLDDDKLSRHDALVERLPGILRKVRVLNEFAERLWCVDRDDLTKKVVTEQLRPLLEQARSAHPAVGRAAVLIAFPSICSAHQRLALDLLKELPDADADAALHNAAMLKMRHLAGQEPDNNGRFDQTKLRPEDVYDVIDLLENMRTDSIIFTVMNNLVESVNDKSNRTKFTATQKADWSARLASIAASKMPDKKNIQHEGYRIVSTALAYSLRDVQWSSWESLIKQAENVPNAADRGYIYLMLGAALPSKYSGNHRKQLLDRSIEEINKIPSPVDRLSHLQDYAEKLHASDAVAAAKECLKIAMKLSLGLENQARIANHRRELIDIADQIDPGFADELIELVDDDPARAQLKSDAKKAVALAKAKRSMANAKQLKDAASCDIDLLPTAAWKNLAALEAGRLEVKPIDVMTQYVTMAASGTLYQAYPVLSWHITNMERKYVQINDVKSQLEPLCEALLLSTELTEAILRRVAGRGADVREEVNDEGFLVRRRERAAALQFIENWLQTNAEEEIVYCDPYFSTKDISFLRLCLANAPECRIKIIASKPQLIKQNELSEEPFLREWRAQSDQSPPETEIIAPAYVENPEKHVIHDRWLLTKGAGLRIGTSFNSLGDGKLSEISEIDPGRVSDIAAQLDQYISRQRVVDAARIQYSTFTLY
ncbi:hypothetical protein [Ralstonia sp. UBA689]|uniref:hypothetical protein n=1 Tax=Ralstonia sp. UBA689 TaxID=1947373 RepID=UPI0025E3959C|nr:hypothetical protein [Ralstonia sp. UBA689]